MATLALVTCGLAAAIALTAAQRPSALAQVMAGQWEFTGVAGAKGPIRECIADIAMLARFEHRTRSCSSSIIKDNPSSTVAEYSCGGADFGRSQVDVITPRSLRISTQGISDGMPFNYVMEARRLGDCTKTAAVSSH